MKTEPNTKPSELAMKAAADIAFSEQQGYPPPEVIDIARIIDRETNLPTLLKQRDALREACEAVLEYSYSGLDGQMLKKLNAALALCDKVEDAPQVISTHIRWNEKGEAEVIETTMDKDGKIHPTVKK